MAHAGAVHANARAFAVSYEGAVFADLNLGQPVALRGSLGAGIDALAALALAVTNRELPRALDAGLGLAALARLDALLAVFTRTVQTAERATGRSGLPGAVGATCFGNVSATAALCVGAIGSPARFAASSRSSTGAGSCVANDATRASVGMGTAASARVARRSTRGRVASAALGHRCAALAQPAGSVGGSKVSLRLLAASNETDHGRK